MYLSSLTVYPVKSAAGIALNQAIMEKRGLRHDRRWMLVDSGGSFLSQRSHPRMALISPTVVDECLMLSAPGMPRLQMPLAGENRETILVDVWRYSGLAETTTPEVDAWFSEFLDTQCRAVYMPDSADRPANPDYAPAGSQVSFADGYPYMLLSDASVDDLNSRLDQHLPMNRFRPNLTVSGCKPFAEDSWKVLRIGEAMFQVTKPCARCAITTVDQQTGTKAKEPLRTLATYRAAGGEVHFGQNLVALHNAILRVGDEVSVLETQ